MTESRYPVSSGYATGIAALAAMLICLIAVNFLAGGLRWRRDLTEEQLYTLSDGTREILAGLERPVTLTFYFSKSLPEAPAQIKTYARHVEDLLHEYRMAGGRMLHVDIVDPRPDTEAEEWAIRQGITGHPVDHVGNRLYMGLTAVCGNALAAIPLLDPYDEKTLEYDISRMVLRVSRDIKPRVGVISRLPVLGEAAPPFMDPRAMHRQTPRPWAAFQELQGDFQVREIQLPAESIDPDINALLLVHPPDMDEASLLAIDQYLLGGGALIVFLDPLSVTELETGDSARNLSYGMPDAKSSLEPLTTAWGVEWNAAELVADIDAATRVHGEGRRIEENPLLLSLSENAFDPDDIITAGLQNLLLPMAGHFTVTPVENLSYDKIIRSSPNVMLADVMTAQFGIRSLMQQFEPRHESCTLALRVHGAFKTAFPEGMIVESNALPGKTEDNNGDATTETATRMPDLKKSVLPGSVLLVGDADMLNDAYAVRQIPMFGTEFMQPINDNINFLLNAVEQAGGGMELLAIRARGRSARPFTRVQELENKARLRWIDEEQRLQNQLQMTEQRLRALRREGDQTQEMILTGEQRREIERFRAEQARTQAALREVRKNLRRDIERLGLHLKIINIALAPFLVVLCGIGFALLRRIRMRRITA